MVGLFSRTIRWVRTKLRKAAGSAPEFVDEKMKETMTPVSILEVNVILPSKVIFVDVGSMKQFDPAEFAQIPAVALGEGTVGPLFKAVLNCGSIVTVRRVRNGPLKKTELESWIQFFGGIRDKWLCPILFSFWYGDEAFLGYDYMCLGSLEELLHGKEGIQFTPLNWGIRLQISLCAAMAVANLHSRVSHNGKPLVCGVIKSSNVLIRTDFTACLTSYETPYLASPTVIIRRNAGRSAPELIKSHGNLHFTHKSDVYSFGVFLLEIVTGKKPMFSNDDRDEIRLVDYIKNKKMKDGVRTIYDEKMGEVTDSMGKMIEVALVCIKADPSERPTMESIAKMIRQLQS
ncbi:probable inactive receptor kinase At2g26730 [Aristolochia californica]|uniref:probable inactive receptor kinase At2g26730 n=1 Tax=Aristolochia californica TaxID=171875 RepID=UPI0035DC63B7